MPAYPREEMEEMVERWLQANKDAEEAGDWKGLADLFAEDATYGWNYGPENEFMAVGRDEIRDIAVGLEMGGLDGWVYPYQQILIDEKAGQVVGFWKQIALATRADGSHYEVAGIGGSWFGYAGDFQWRFQRDWFDYGNAAALLHGDDGRRHAVGGHDRPHAPQPRRRPARPLRHRPGAGADLARPAGGGVMAERFADKVAIVTGAAGGIGEAYARALARGGRRGRDRRPRRRAGRAGRQGPRESGPCSCAPTSATTSQPTPSAPPPSSAFGGIDLLVNNAAIYGGMQIDSLLNVDWDYYRRFMSVNLDGALVVTRACYKAHPQAGRRRHREPDLHRRLDLLGLLRPREGRHQRPHPAAGRRARRLEHPGERHRPRPDRHRGHPQRGARRDRRRHRQDAQHQAPGDAAGPRRHVPLPPLRRRGLDHRPDLQRRRRPDRPLMSDVGAVGFIGLGQIGAPMATRLAAWPGGLHVFDLRDEAMAPLVEAGATAAGERRRPRRGLRRRVGDGARRRPGAHRRRRAAHHRRARAPSSPSTPPSGPRPRRSWPPPPPSRASPCSTCR